MTRDADDLNALQQSLNDAARRLRTSWISLLSTSAYLGVAAATITHRDLLFESPFTLPLVNIALPLVAFGFAGPTLVLVLLLNFIVGFAFVADRADAYTASLDRTAPIGSERRHSINQRLGASIFAQLLVGRESFGSRAWLRVLSAAVLCVTVILGPLFVIFLFLVVFLPYQSDFLTWTQRALWALGILALAFTLPRIFWRSNTGSSAGRLAHYASPSAAWMVAGVAVALLAGVPHLPHELQATLSAFGGPTPFVNHLVLPDTTITDADLADKLDANEATSDGPSSAKMLRSFVGRRLAGAVFDRSDLRRVNFQGAFLAHASFVNARLSHARFGCLQGLREGFGNSRWPLIDTACANLTSANLSQADLEQAELASTILHGANLNTASLHGANLSAAELLGADLYNVHAYGVTAQGVILIGANLMAASFLSSDLSGAHLSAANLTRSSFAFARLDGAILVGARLWSTNLTRAKLRSAQLQHADIRRVEAWGSRTDDRALRALLDPKSSPLVSRPKLSPIYPFLVMIVTPLCPDRLDKAV